MTKFYANPNFCSEDIENIQMFLLNMAFISLSEVENIFHFTSEIKGIFNKSYLNFLFIVYNHLSKEVHSLFLATLYLYFWLCPLTMNMRAC